MCVTTSKTMQISQIATTKKYFGSLWLRANERVFKCVCASETKTNQQHLNIEKEGERDGMEGRQHELTIFWAISASDLYYSLRPFEW